MYGQLFQSCPILTKKCKHKILTQKNRAMRLGIICFFLCNCRTCFCGNQVNTMFESTSPTIEEYLPLNEVIPRFDLNLEE